MDLSDSFFVTIVRHGETDYNLSKTVETDSNTDVSLNETGSKQAMLLGKYLSKDGFTRIISSGLLRANETAEAIISSSASGPLNLEIDERIRERNIGVGLKGCTVATWIMEAFNWSQKEKQPVVRYNPPGCETYEEIKSRITSFFNELCNNHDAKSDDNNVLIVSHGIWILTLMEYLLSSPDFVIDRENSMPNLEKILKTIIRNTSIAKLQIYRQQSPNEPRRLKILKFNEHAHILDMGNSNPLKQ